jgi:hypothetical protein
LILLTNLAQHEIWSISLKSVCTRSVAVALDTHPLHFNTIVITRERLPKAGAHCISTILSSKTWTHCTFSKHINIMKYDRGQASNWLNLDTTSSPATHSQCNHGHFWKLFLEDSKIFVVGSKVMSPLTATMSFLQRKTNNSHENQQISILTIKKDQNNIKTFP